MRKLSVVSYNAFGTPFYGSKIRHKFLRTKISLRFRKIGQILNASDADILCFQEVYTFRHLNRLKIQLTAFPYCIYKKYLFTPRGGLVIFSKYPIKSWEYIDFSTKGKYWNKTITGRLTKRGMLHIQLVDSPLHIINTHLVQNSSDSWHEENKFVAVITSQLQEIAEISKKMQDPYILLGDFNIPKNSQQYTNFLADSGCIDAFARETRPTYIKEFLFNKKSAERNDYIFYKGDMFSLAKATHILAKKEQLENGMLAYLSDHIGLQAIFSIKG